MYSGLYYPSGQMSNTFKLEELKTATPNQMEKRCHVSPLTEKNKICLTRQYGQIQKSLDLFYDLFWSSNQHDWFWIGLTYILNGVQHDETDAYNCDKDLCYAVLHLFIYLVCVCFFPLLFSLISFCFVFVKRIWDGRVGAGDYFVNLLWMWLL